MSARGQLRIIGGRWRSRRLRCADAPGLRPSADAVRETLFNWLPHSLRGQVCLDLFAGSGALGFEAASRDAARVVMVESNRVAAAQLRANRDQLGAHDDAIEIIALTAQNFLRRHCAERGAKRGFDLVFLDPPFDGDALAPACRDLQRRGLLNPDALVYIESPHAANTPLPIPAAWHIIRHKRCGRVRATLLRADAEPLRDASRAQSISTSEQSA
ncbi:MAG: 16S rRNA (guanine(966)-N(2))-methyltransferase RsmD [bacterium]